MPIKVRQSSGLTADNDGNGNPTVAVKGSSLTHAELDENFKSTWPVGSIYMNVLKNENPRKTLGFGMWKAFGRQSILVGHNDSPPSRTHDDTSSQIFGRKIYSAKVIRISSLKQSFLELQIGESNTPNPFSEGQRVTIKGITGAQGIQPNKEQTIRCLGKYKELKDIVVPPRQHSGQVLGTASEFRKFITVTFDSPSTDPNYKFATMAQQNSLAVNIGDGATVRLFGTRYNENCPSYPSWGGYVGTGGEISHNLKITEMPSHNHSIDWVPRKIGTNVSWQMRNASWARGDASRTSFSVGSNKGTEIPTKGFERNGLTGEEEKLSSRGFNASLGSSNLSNSTLGHAHNNLMPFIGAYMWLRIE